MTFMGVVFAAASWQFGLVEEVTGRFAGVSGNPNRMVLGLLVFAPFVAASAMRTQRWWLRLGLCAVLALSLFLIARSGSDQGIVGVVLLLVLAVILATRRVDPLVVVVLSGALAVALFWLALQVGLFHDLSADVRTLSGRTEAYSAGYREILAHPWIGSGQVHVATTRGADLSAHNSMIGITASAGLFAGLAWSTLLAQAVRGSLISLRRGELAGSIGLVVVVSQLVQSVEFVPLAWMALLASRGTAFRNREYASD